MIYNFPNIHSTNQIFNNYVYIVSKEHTYYAIVIEYFKTSEYDMPHKTAWPADSSHGGGKGTAPFYEMLVLIIKEGVQRLIGIIENSKTGFSTSQPPKENRMKKKKNHSWRVMADYGCGLWDDDGL